MSPLPRLLLLTDRTASAVRGRSVVESVRLSVEGGAQAVVLREKDLPPAERRELAETLLEILRPFHATLIIASDVQLAQSLQVDWVHLAARDPRSAQSGLHAGRSCHNFDELRRASDEQLAYITLSPIFTTTSKPHYGPEIGLNNLACLLRQKPLPPTYALGGVDPASARSCLDAGAYGIAVMGAVMGADDPSEVTAALLAEVAETAPPSLRRTTDC